MRAIPHPPHEQGMPRKGFEPPLPRGKRILSPPRLPFRHLGRRARAGPRRSQFPCRSPTDRIGVSRRKYYKVVASPFQTVGLHFFLISSLLMNASLTRTSQKESALGRVPTCQGSHRTVHCWCIATQAHVPYNRRISYERDASAKTWSGVQMPQPTIDERFREGPPTRGAQDRHKWMNSDERRFVLWGLKEGWSAARIGRALGVNEATVRRFRKRFSQDPELLLELGLYEMLGRAQDDEYRCLVCGDQVVGQLAVKRHILSHFLDEPKVHATLLRETRAREPDDEQAPSEEVGDRGAMGSLPAHGPARHEPPGPSDHSNAIVGEPVSLRPPEQSVGVEPDATGSEETLQRLASDRGDSPPPTGPGRDVEGASMERQASEQPPVDLGGIETSQGPRKDGTGGSTRRVESATPPTRDATPWAPDYQPATEDDVPDAAVWHDAFERLAAERGQVEPTRGPRDEDTEVTVGRQDSPPLRTDAPTPTTSSEYRHAPEDDVPDSSRWHDAFERLAAERGQRQASQGPGDEVREGGATRDHSDRLRHPPLDWSAIEPPPSLDTQPAEGVSRSGGSDRHPQQPTGHGAIKPPLGPETGEVVRTNAPDQSVAQHGDVQGIYGPPAEDDKRAGGSASPSLGEGRPGHHVLGRKPTLLSRLMRVVSPTAGPSSTLRSMASRGRETLRYLPVARSKEVTSITIEHGCIKLLATRGLEVIDYRIVDSRPQHFREGLASDTPGLAREIKKALSEMNGKHRHVVGAVPGYQTTLRRLDLPNARGMDPKVIIPQEARRTLGISTENSTLTWHRLPGGATTARWLVLSATNRSMSSLATAARGAGLRLEAMELRPFALARAIHRPDAICAWASVDGCDAVVVQDWAPVTHHSSYWGAGSTVEPDDLVNRLTEVVESAIETHDMQEPEMSVPDDTPLYVTGSPVGREASIPGRVAANVRHPAARLEPPIQLPPGFPVSDLIVNIGLALWGA